MADGVAECALLEEAEDRLFFAVALESPINKRSSSEGDSLGMATAIKDLSSQTPGHQSHHPPF